MTWPYWIALLFVACGAAYRLGEHKAGDRALAWERRYRVGRLRSNRWLRHERNKRRDIEFCAMELELELEQYRNEERAAEARVWKWN